MSETYTFEHIAMKTTFKLRLLSEEKGKTKKVSRQCFERIDSLETKLSRYYSGSDVYLINHMRAGESIFIDEDCYECLKQAMQVYEQTSGLFDCSLGRQIEHHKNGIDDNTPALMGQLKIDPKRPAVHCVEPGREIDLGGIGKGYALDCLKDICLDWGIENGLLSAGTSTHLAFGTIKWPIRLNSGKYSRVVKLHDCALSTSGTDVNGSHIISPDLDRPKVQHKRIWLSTKRASSADAWSTAALLMDRKELEEISSEQICVYLVDSEAIMEL